MTSTGRHDAGASGKTGWAALVLAALVTATSCAYRLPLVGLHADDGQYVVAAKALATGQGYRQLQAPGAPAQTKYPIGFPLLLAALWRVWPAFPGNETLLSGACSASLGVAAALWFVWARRRGLSTGQAAAWTLAAFTLPALSGLCAQIMSEAPFVVLLVSGLSGLDLAETDEPLPMWPALALGLAAAIRTIGVSVVLAVVAWAVWHRRARFAFLAAALGPPAAWLAWSVAARDSASSGLGAYGTSYQGWLAGLPPAAWLVILRDNLLSLFVHTGHLVAQGAMGALPDPARPPAALAVGAVVVAGSVAAARRVGSPAPWALAGYVVLTLAWPWPPSRFIVVILPVAFMLLACAWPSRTVQRALGALAVVVALLGLGHALNTVRQSHAEAGLRTAGPVVAWSDYDALFTWLARNTPPDAIVASVAEPMVYLYAGRQGVFPYAQDTVAINYSNPPSIGSARDLDALLERQHASFLVRLPAPEWAHTALLDEVIATLRRTNPSRLQSVYVGRDRRFEVFSVKGARP